MQCKQCGTDLPPHPGEAELDQIFAAIYRRIEAHPAEPGLDKDAAVEVVREIEREAAGGADADPEKIEPWLKSLAFISPDILAITVSGLAGSESGISTVIREIARRTKENPDAS